jgi:Fic family protein
MTRAGDRAYLGPHMPSRFLPCHIHPPTNDPPFARNSAPRVSGRHSLGAWAGSNRNASRGLPCGRDCGNDARRDAKICEPLTENRLLGWHAALFPTGRSGMRKITTAAWRTGPEGRQKVHFEAPGPETVDGEMNAFLTWFDDPKTEMEPLIKAGLAHLYFATIHPFEDGNGRIARAITEMSLARLEDSAQRFYSMSSQIREERKDYYATLESTQKGGMDVRSGLSGFSIVSPARSTRPMN